MSFLNLTTGANSLASYDLPAYRLPGVYVHQCLAVDHDIRVDRTGTS